MSVRVVVTGGREFTDAAMVETVLSSVHQFEGISRLAHGAARGLDTLAGQWAKFYGVECQPYPVSPAEWTRFGGYAGHRRNGMMLDAERPDVVIAFPGGDGTANCVEQAGARGIVVIPAVEIAASPELKAA